MLRRSIVLVLLVTTLALLAIPAFAGHAHFIMTPNGECHQVASGQTGISDPSHGGYHRYHDQVHAGATGGSTAAPYNLGDGNSVVAVYRDDCVAP